jgi:hypothetical protein
MAPVTTTMAPVTTTMAPTTTMEPVTTTMAPTTTMEPVTTTMAPTTTMEPVTTTMSPTTTTLPQTVFSFSTVMDCEQATTCSVPPCTGSGSGSLTLDTVTGLMTYDVSFMNLSASETISHIHGPAEPGVPAGVAVDLPLGTPKVGQTTLSPEKQAEMLAGLYYVNVHSTNCLGGEIRGQILLTEAGTTGSASFEKLEVGAVFR